MARAESRQIMGHHPVIASTYNDVTDRVVMATWVLGTRRPYSTSSLALVLKNHDQHFSSEHAAGPLG